MWITCMLCIICIYTCSLSLVKPDAGGFMIQFPIDTRWSAMSKHSYLWHTRSRNKQSTCKTTDIYKRYLASSRWRYFIECMRKRTRTELFQTTRRCNARLLAFVSACAARMVHSQFLSSAGVDVRGHRTTTMSISYRVFFRSTAYPVSGLGTAPKSTTDASEQ